jgi:hypothetical protein
MARGRGREWWLERVVEQAASGLSVAEFFRRRKLSCQTFYGWLRKLAAEPTAVTNSESLNELEPRQLPFIPLERLSEQAVESGFSLTVARCWRYQPSGSVFAWCSQC